MKFFIGALSLAVILAIFGTPVVLLLAGGALTASDRQAISRGVKSIGWGDSGRERESWAPSHTGSPS
jgi:hypothetical protein